MIKSIADVRGATTKELIEFWNTRMPEHAVDKFPSRRNGEQRVIAVIELQKTKHALAVAQTWEDPAVKAARSIKDGVMVAWNGLSSDFKSTRQAFVALELPLTKCIRFRAALKAKGKATFTHDGVDYKFFIANNHEESTTSH